MKVQRARSLGGRLPHSNGGVFSAVLAEFRLIFAFIQLESSRPDLTVNRGFDGEVALNDDLISSAIQRLIYHRTTPESD